MPGVLLTQRSKKTTHRLSLSALPVEVNSANAQLGQQDFACISANNMLKEAITSLLTIPRLHPLGALRDALPQVKDNYPTISYRDLRLSATQGEAHILTAICILPVFLE